MYPITEELHLLEELPERLRGEALEPGSHRERILELIKAQARGPRTGLLISILHDVLALLGETWSDGITPIETEEGRRIADREARFEHVLARLERYRASAPAESFAPALFSGTVSRIVFEGKSIEVEEVARPGYGCILLRERGGGGYLLDYLIPHGIAEIPATYRLTAVETDEYDAGALDLQALYQRLIRGAKP